jgi:hypothetical protein
MSWIEKIKTNIEITTGDGKIYRPLYMISSKKVDYNFAEFVFPEIKGTLVKRELAKGARYSWELTFQGENHLDVAFDFERSADDRRPWRVYHPMFGDLLVQPSSITIDPTGLNTSKINVEVIETITEDAPIIDVDPTDKTKNDVLNLGEITAASFAANVSPGVADINQMENNISTVYELGSSEVLNGDQSNEYFNLYNDALTKVLNAGTETLGAASAMIDLIYFPGEFVSNLRGRLNLLIIQFTALGDKLADLIDPNSKSIYETNAGSIVGAMINATVNPIENDYGSTADVLDTIETVMNVYNQYIANLDLLQSGTGGDPQSYIPDYNAQSALNTLVNYSVSQLFNIATTSKQERTLILEADSNVLLLAHRFYGLTVNDSTIDSFIAQNNIGSNEYLIIKKGRKLVYFI